MNQFKLLPSDNLFDKALKAILNSKIDLHDKLMKRMNHIASVSKCSSERVILKLQIYAVEIEIESLKSTLKKY